MLNMDFSQRIVIDNRDREWVPSPRPGVWRKPLAREDAERGHATSIVRYDPGSKFHAHDHPLGEEILVLSGTFSDETGDYPAGTYFRNPEGFRHAPFSEEGCELLVKLHHFQDDDSAHVVIDTLTTPFQPHTHHGGEEIYVIKGELLDENGHYPAGTWIRSPHLSSHNPYVEQDTLIWVKVGHL